MYKSSPECWSAEREKVEPYLVEQEVCVALESKPERESPWTSWYSVFLQGLITGFQDTGFITVFFFIPQNIPLS